MGDERRRVLNDVINEAANHLDNGALEPVPIPAVPEEPPNADDRLPVTPQCVTQAPTDRPAALMVGLRDVIPRWRPGSVIKFAAWRMGYQSQEDANFGALHLWIAAKCWNAANIGVRIEPVHLAADADFVIYHGTYRGRHFFAEAFFPNDTERLNVLEVYSPALEPKARNNLWKVLLHECGHILGFRHEDAATEIVGGAVQFDEPNRDSVMRPYSDGILPTIQQSDIESARAFYQMEEGAMIGNARIRDYDPPRLRRQVN